MRLTVIEFDNLPEKDEERIALVRFRLKKTVLFDDVDTAAVSCTSPCAGNKVVVAVAPAEIVAQYVSSFRAAGLQPGIDRSALTFYRTAASHRLPTPGCPPEFRSLSRPGGQQRNPDPFPLTRHQ